MPPLRRCFMGAVGEERRPVLTIAFRQYRAGMTGEHRTNVAEIWTHVAHGGIGQRSTESPNLWARLKRLHTKSNRAPPLPNVEHTLGIHLRGKNGCDGEAWRGGGNIASPLNPSLWYHRLKEYQNSQPSPVSDELHWATRRTAYGRPGRNRKDRRIPRCTRFRTLCRCYS
jgi:hypothetical protein